MELVDVVRKLVGPVRPVGETNADDERFENLKALTELVDALLGDINTLAPHRNRYEFSIKRAGEYAAKFLDETQEALEGMAEQRRESNNG